MNSKLLSFIIILFSSFILMNIAFQNGYPLVYVGDTGSYIKYGFEKNHAHDGCSHSFFYGLFLYFSSFKESLFYVIFFQSLFMTYILHVTVKCFLGNSKYVLLFSMLVIICLAFFTGLGKFTGKIMPDVFTGILILSCFNIIYNQYLNKFDYVAVGILFAFSIAFHNSHFTSIIITLALYVVFLVFYNKNYLKAVKYRFVLLFILIIVQYLAVISTNYFYSNKFYYSKGKHVFLMSKMSEYGILNEFLKEKGDSCNYKLCKYRDTYIDFNTFLWHWELSPTLIEFNGKEGYDVAWTNCEKEYNTLLLDILKNKKYLFSFLSSSSISSFTLFFNPYEVLEVNWHDNSIDEKIVAFFPKELYLFRGSLQSTSRFSETDKRIHTYQSIIIPVSILLIFLPFLKGKKYNWAESQFLLLFSLFLFINALICGTVSVPESRFQERIIWIYPLFVLIFYGRKLIFQKINIKDSKID